MVLSGLSGGLARGGGQVGEALADGRDVSTDSHVRKTYLTSGWLRDRGSNYF